jgi:hypothetical protein
MTFLRSVKDVQEQIGSEMMKYKGTLKDIQQKTKQRNRETNGYIIAINR